MAFVLQHGRNFRIRSCYWRQRHAGFATSQRREQDVRIVEVGPRDGLQNEKTTVSLETKIELIKRLSRTGLKTVEAGSFVAPKWVPQMANSAEVLHQVLTRSYTSTESMAYNFLIPNMKGLQNFLAAVSATRSESATAESSEHIEPSQDDATAELAQDGSARRSSSAGANETLLSATKYSSIPISEISVFTAATEAFCRANTNCSISESLTRVGPIISLAKSHSLRIRGYVSVALGCPYKGPDVDPHRVAEITRTLLAMGCDEVSVADTTGMGTARKTQELLKALRDGGVALEDLALHFHDTYGQALVNVLVGLDYGVRCFDSSVGGLGGCPYSKGATGNVSTEDLVYCLNSVGMETGVDLQAVAEIGEWISRKLGRTNESRVGKAILANMSSN